MMFCFGGLISWGSGQPYFPDPKKTNSFFHQRVSMSGASEGSIHPCVGNDSLPSMTCKVTDMTINEYVPTKSLPSTRSTRRAISEDTLGPNSIIQENPGCSGTPDRSIFMLLVANQRTPGEVIYSSLLYLARQQTHLEQFLSG